MTKRISSTYKPAELTAAIMALCHNSYHDFHESEAHVIVKALFAEGFLIVKAEKL